MSDIQFLDRLGDELRRATREGSAVGRRPHVPRASVVFVGIAGVAALLLVLGPFIFSGGMAGDQTTASSETSTVESDIETLTVSFENIRFEIGQAQLADYSPGNGALDVPYPRDVIDGLGPDFSMLHVPTYLPDGYSLYGTLRRGSGFDRAPRIQTQALGRDDSQFFVIEQFARGFTPSSIEQFASAIRTPVDIAELRLHVVRDESDHSVYFFERDGIWFVIISGGPTDVEGLTTTEASRIANSLVAVEASGWGDVSAVEPTVPVFSGASYGASGDPTGKRGRRC